MSQASPSAPQPHIVEQLAQFVRNNSPMLVLTGAGISAPSGIPEYRDEEGNWKHSKPIQFNEFMQSDYAYRRYWARSSIGWLSMGKARPNPAHQALAALEHLRFVSAVITQNVDGLHQRAGQQHLINLHGQLHTVSCQSCAYQQDRTALQAQIKTRNATWFASHSDLSASQKPDGDADLDGQDYSLFEPPFCPQCDSKIKPDVVFFGENIPRQTAQDALQAQQDAKGLLVVGSSLMVFSGFRIARSFHQRQLPIALVNIGKTRADDLIEHKFPLDASVLLPQVVEHLKREQT